MEEEQEQLVTIKSGTFNIQAHLNYFMIASHVLPSHYTSLDPSRLSAVYFVLVAIDLLNGIEHVSKDKYVDYIYMLQLSASNESITHGYFGFIGGTFGAHNVVKANEVDKSDYEQSHIWHQQQGHIAMIYTALCSLISLEDDLVRVDRAAISAGLRHLALDNGSYKSYVYDGEGSDVRFVYCAIAIAHILDLWDQIEKEKTAQFIISCLTYEGGFSLQPGSEAQGGATYCAVAALAMMGCLEYLEEFQRINLISWCQRRYDVKFSSYFEFNTLLDRAQEGFQGRTNKVPDSCYAFWIGASLKILASFDEVDFSQVDSFILNSCQSMGGGFSKYPDTFADILHSFYSVCWLSMRTHLEELDPLLAIRKSKADKFRARFSKS